MSYRSRAAHGARTHVDVSLLQISDRACLRLLEHTRVCTATQLASLIYPSIRTALRRTRNLWQKHLVIRESLPAERGGIPLAYRLSESGRRRLHLSAYRSPGLVTLRHSLDGVELVSSLVRHNPGLVQLWLTESHIPQLDGVKPDQLVVIDTGDASALILVEVDESTERPPVIRERLYAYAKLFEEHRVGWHLLWVTNSPERLARLRQIAAPMKLAALAGRCWGVPIDEVSDLGASTEVLAVGAGLPPRLLRAIAADPKARGTEYPVGSLAWVRLLANGGLESMAGLWQGGERRPAEPGEVVAAESAPVGEVVAADSPDRDQPVEVPQPVAEPVPVQPSAAPIAHRPFRLADMTNSELAALIDGPDRNLPQASDAAKLLADRGAWMDLCDALEVLCRSNERDEQLLGLSLVRQYRSGDFSFRLASNPLLHDLIRRAESSIADAARDVLDEMPTGG